MGFPGGSDSKESACSVGDLGLIPGLGRSGEGHGNPLQYSYLENPHGQRSVWATVYGIAESDRWPAELDRLILGCQMRGGVWQARSG